MTLIADYPPDEDAEIEQQRHTALVIDRVITALALGLVPLGIMVVYFSTQEGWSWEPITELLAFSVIWCLALFKRVPNPTMRTAAVIGFLMLAAFSEIYRYGILTATMPALAIVPILGTVIWGARYGVALILVVVAAMTGLAFVTVSLGNVPPNFSASLLFAPDEWALRIVNVLVAMMLGVYVTGSLYRAHQNKIGELVRQNQQLKKARSRLTHSADLAGLGYALSNPGSGRILHCDNRYAEMHGLTVEKFLTLDITDDIVRNLVHKDERENAMELRQALMRREVATSEMRHVLPSGQERFLRKVFTPLPGNDELYEVVGQDITEEKQAQDQLFQAQKMDAIGKLTGGVAHDFNNLLAVILGNLELLAEEDKTPRQDKLINDSIGATLRGAELSQNMLSFARRARLKPTRVDLNDIARSLEGWIGRTIPASITVEMSLSEGLHLCEIDQSSAESSLLNLVLNARDAMPRGGTLLFETSNVVLQPGDETCEAFDLAPGAYVRLSVSDTGEGMAPETAEHIFEPFFTTKATGQGSGLGLSMVQGFARQSGGAVGVTSDVGVGTTFQLFFPALPAGTEPQRPATVAPAPVEHADGQQTVLLVEDNPHVLNVLRLILLRAGYSVIPATSGDAAYVAFQNAPRIDLLLTDMVMHGDLQGPSLSRKLREHRHGLPVVFMSGYAKEEAFAGEDAPFEEDCLMKPVQRTELLREVAGALAVHEPAE
ncbi:MAG: ATP-binding protein [Pseudomonadota bacterium]